MGRGRSSSGGGSRGFSSSGSRGMSRSSSRGMSRSSSRGMSRSSSGSSYSHRSRRSHSGTHITIRGGGGSGGVIVPLIVGIIFMLVGSFTVVMGIVQCFGGIGYSTVNARCVRNDYIDGWYYTTYEYTVDGIDYTNRSQEGWERPEENIGGIIEIYYLKEDPNIITEKDPGNIGESIAIVIFGVIFAGLGSLPVIITIKQLKQARSNHGDPISISSTNTSAPQTKRCAYCGSQYSASSSNCPHCGANRNK